MYNGEHGSNARKNCCLKDDLMAEVKVVKDVVSGPAYCPGGKSNSQLMLTIIQNVS